MVLVAQMNFLYSLLFCGYRFIFAGGQVGEEGARESCSPSINAMSSFIPDLHSKDSDSNNKTSRLKLFP